MNASWHSALSFACYDDSNVTSTPAKAAACSPPLESAANGASNLSCASRAGCDVAGECQIRSTGFWIRRIFLTQTMLTSLGIAIPHLNEPVVSNKEPLK